MLAFPGEVGQIHIKTEPQEEEEPLSQVVFLQRRNTDLLAMNQELDAENEELKATIKKLREKREKGEGEGKGKVSLANLELN